MRPFSYKLRLDKSLLDLLICYTKSNEVNFMLIWIIVLSSLSVGIFAYLFTRFIFYFKKYKYRGNAYVYVGVTYLLCLAYTITLKLNPVNAVDKLSLGLALTSSFFDSVRMSIGSFDVKVIQGFNSSNELWRVIFSYAFVVTSICSLIATSISVILSFWFQLKPKAINLVKDKFGKKDDRENVFIFTEPRVKVSIKLAEKLRESGDYVRVIISRKSQSTQEGQEFKNRLVGEGFDVWTENTSSNFASFIINNYWKKNPKHKTMVYGLFDSDEANIRYANQFEKALTNNKRFKRICSTFLYKKEKDAKLDIEKLENKILKEEGQVEKNRLENELIYKKQDLEAIELEIKKYEEKGIKPYKKKLAKRKIIVKDGNTERLEEKDVDIRYERCLNTLENIRIFLTYQDFDCNCIYRYDVETLGIINSI